MLDSGFGSCGKGDGDGSGFGCGYLYVCMHILSVIGFYFALAYILLYSYPPGVNNFNKVVHSLVEVLAVQSEKIEKEKLLVRLIVFK